MQQSKRDWIQGLNGNCATSLRNILCSWRFWRAFLVEAISPTALISASLVMYVRKNSAESLHVSTTCRILPEVMQISDCVNSLIRQGAVDDK